MKTRLILTVVGIGLFAVVGEVQAANPVWENTREQIRERRETITDQIKERREEAKATISARRQELRSEVARMHAERLSNRFGFYNRRLTTVIEKTQERIDKVKTEGKDVSGAQAKLDEAKAKLSEANKLSVEAVAKFRSIDPARYNEQRPVAEAARDLAQRAREAFVVTVRLLRECVELLKALR